MPLRLKLLALISLVLASGLSLFFKLSLESPKKALAIADSTVLSERAQPLLKTLRALHQHGLYGITLYEETLQTLLDRGEVSRIGNTYYAPHPLLLQIAEKLKFSLPPSAMVFRAQNALHISLPLSPRQLKLGFNPRELSLIRTAGLHPVLRIENRPFPNPAALDRYFDYLTSLHASPYLIFSGSEVLGYASGISQVAEAMKRGRFHLARIEFARQKGEQALHAKLKRALWVHSVKPEELASLSQAALASRYSRAIRERSVQIIYLHPLAKGSFDDPLPPLIALLDTLSHRHLLTAQLPPASQASFSKLWYGALGFLLGTALLSLTLSLSPLPPFLWVFPIVTALLSASSFAWLAALLFSILAPSLLTFTAFQWSPRGSPLLNTLLLTLLALLFSLSLHGILARPAYLERLLLFRGVKLTFLLPLAFSLGLLLKETSQLTLAALRRLLSTPLTLKTLLLAAIGFLLLALLLIRTGNEGTAWTSLLELKLRGALEQLFFVRPRFKALLGYALLYPFLKLTVEGRRHLATYLLPFITLAFATTANTFSHLHTPVLLSMLRTLLGALLGLGIGLLLSTLYFTLERRFLECSTR